MLHAFIYTKYLIEYVSYINNMSWFRLTTFQVLNSIMWLVVTMLDNARSQSRVIPFFSLIKLFVFNDSLFPTLNWEYNCIIYMFYVSIMKIKNVNFF